MKLNKSNGTGHKKFWEQVTKTSPFKGKINISAFCV